VVHDDAEEMPDGTTDAAASSKLVSLGGVLDWELAKDTGSGYILENDV
jgi:hypothetical protein